MPPGEGRKTKRAPGDYSRVQGLGSSGYGTWQAPQEPVTGVRLRPPARRDRLTAAAGTAALPARSERRRWDGRPRLSAFLAAGTAAPLSLRLGSDFDSRDGYPTIFVAAGRPGRAERDRTQAGGIPHAGRGGAISHGGGTDGEAWGRAPALRSVALPGGGGDSRDGYLPAPRLGIRQPERLSYFRCADREFDSRGRLPRFRRGWGRLGSGRRDGRPTCCTRA